MNVSFWIQVAMSYLVQVLWRKGVKVNEMCSKSVSEAMLDGSL